jgi:hypothetical protein
MNGSLMGNEIIIKMTRTQANSEFTVILNKIN